MTSGRAFVFLLVASTLLVMAAAQDGSGSAAEGELTDVIPPAAPDAGAGPVATRSDAQAVSLAQYAVAALLMAWTTVYVV